jgi:hypothetical protein
MSKKTVVQNVVLANVLSEWDDTLSFPRILKEIADGNQDRVIVWESLEDVDGQALASLVSDLVRDFTRVVEKASEEK